MTSHSKTTPEPPSDMSLTSDTPQTKNNVQQHLCNEIGD
jgi:hypothetical protein